MKQRLSYTNLAMNNTPENPNQISTLQGVSQLSYPMMAWRVLTAPITRPLMAAGIFPVQFISKLKNTPLIGGAINGITKYRHRQLALPTLL